MKLFEELQRKGISHFNIGWAKFRLISEYYVEIDGEEIDGLTDFSECTIKVSSKLDYARSRHTLIHEISHVLLSSMWMEDRTKEYGLSAGALKICNEDLAENMARGMMLFHNLNPQLWDILFSTHLT